MYRTDVSPRKPFQSLMTKDTSSTALSTLTAPWLRALSVLPSLSRELRPILRIRQIVLYSAAPCCT
jgi:hypothetical protein